MKVILTLCPLHLDSYAQGKKDGYGINYSIDPDVIKYATAWKSIPGTTSTDGELLTKNIKEKLEEMGEVLKAATVT